MSGPVGKDDDLVIREVRNRIDWGRVERPPPPPGQAEVQRDHDEAVLQCNVDESINHSLLELSAGSFRTRLHRSLRIRLAGGPQRTRPTSGSFAGAGEGGTLVSPKPAEA